MKKTITLLLLIIFGSYSNGQITADLKLEGISPEVEAAMLDGDIISYFGDERVHFNIHVDVKSKGIDRNKSFNQSAPIPRDENGHHTLSHTITLTQSSWLNLDEELDVYIYVNTIYGNRIWTRVKRTKENMDEPIILDHYNAGDSEDLPPKKALAIKFRALSDDKEVKAKVHANEDNWNNRSKEHYRYMLKNEGQSSWAIDITGPPTYKFDGGKMETLIPFNNEVDLTKRLVVRMEVKTAKGNILWHEATIEARMLSMGFNPSGYTVLEQDGSTDEKDEPETTENKEDELEEEVKEETYSDSNADNTDQATQKDKPKVDLVVDSGSTNPVSNGATDLTTKTVIAKCVKDNEGDSLVTINGSQICLNGNKPAGSSANSGLLNFDCNLEIDGTIFPLKAGEYVRYNRVKGTLLEGVLRADTEYKTAEGTILLKAGTKVTFAGTKLSSGFLAEDANLTVDNVTYLCQKSKSDEPNIYFDNNGRLAGCTLGESIVLNLDQSYDVGENSRLVFKNSKIDQVYLSSAATLVIGGNEYVAGMDEQQASLRFGSDKKLESFLSAAGNTYEIEGQTITIQEGSQVRITQENGKAKVERFLAGNEVTLKVYKGSKTKETLVKVGKKIVIKDGKVVKAG